MRIRNKARSVKALWIGVPSLALFLFLGCAPAPRRTVTAPTGPSAPTGPTAPPTTTNEPAEPSAPRVDVERDAGGFTITERVPVTDQVRADYEAARRRLEESQYEPGIALLLKVTEQAPALTAAYI